MRLFGGLGEEALLWLDGTLGSAVGRRRALMTRAVVEAWECVSAISRTHGDGGGSAEVSGGEEQRR